MGQKLVLAFVGLQYSFPATNPRALLPWIHQGLTGKGLGLACFSPHLPVAPPSPLLRALAVVRVPQGQGKELAEKSRLLWLWS